jgi:hypothetical protein
VLFSVPLTTVLNEEYAYVDPEYSQVFARLQDEDELCVFAALLSLHASRTDSQWRPLLDMLPSSLLPAFTLSDELLERLSVSQVCFEFRT